MEKVGSTILKNRWNFFLAKVASGARIVVTDRGRPVARLIPIDDRGEAADIEELVAELIVKGVVSCASTSEAGRLGPPLVSMEVGGKAAADLLIEDRR